MSYYFKHLLVIVLAAVIHIRQIKQGLTIQVDRVLAMITVFLQRSTMPNLCLAGVYTCSHLQHQKIRNDVNLHALL